MTTNLSRVEQFINEVKQLTAKPCFSLVPDFDNKPGITDSKLGGLPYWPADLPYPENDGVKMSLLAQINCNDIEESELLPNQGMIQFFIATNTSNIYGIDFSHPDKQVGFRVVYHPSIEAPIDIEAPRLEECENSPLRLEVAINIEPALSFININESKFNIIFKTVVAKLFQNKEPGEFFDYFNNEEMCTIEQALMFSPTPGHQLTGWPKFTEGDPRKQEQQEQFNTLLLQLGSQFTDDGELLMWGDMGIAQFFIPEENLKSLDFSKVYYTFTTS